MEWALHAAADLGVIIDAIDDVAADAERLAVETVESADRRRLIRLRDEDS